MAKRRPKSATLCFFLGLHLFLLFPASSARLVAQETVSKRFFEEAPRKWKEYSEASLGWSIMSTDRQVDFDKQGAKIRETISKSRFLQNAAKFCSLVAWEVPNQDGQITGACFCENEDYSFELKKSDSGKAWVLAHLVFDKEGFRYQDIKKFIRNNQGGHLPFWVATQGLPDLIAEKRLTIGEIEESGSGADRRVKVSFSNGKGKPNAQRYVKSGWCVLDPNHFWIVREYRVIEFFTYGVEVEEHGAFEFTIKDDALPILKQKTRERKWKENSLDHHQILTEKWGIGEEDASLREFRLSAFGLPDPNGYAMPPEKSSWYFWFAALAVALLALGGYYWRQVHRRKLRVAR